MSSKTKLLISNNVINMVLILKKYLKYLILAAIIYMPIFGHLNSLPIRVWDEARVAMNAYEMLNDGDFIVTHFEGQPDMWNTKPPFLVWTQVVFMKVFGVNELSVRLPSAIAALLTCIILMVISLRYLKSFWFGFIAVVVLVTSQGYINLHSTRTGDYDALLALFTTLSGFAFFAYCETKKTKYLYWVFSFLALSVLTKSISGLLFVPALIIYSVLQRQFLPVLKNKHFYIGLFTFLAVVIGYYLLREAYNPGYLEAVQKNELGGRFMEVNEGHPGGFWYYYDNFIAFQLAEWYILIPCGLLLGLVSKERRLTRLISFSALMILTYFLVISTAQTKLLWYDVPLYPFIALLIAAFIHFVFDSLKNFHWFNQTLSFNIVPFLFLFLIMITPYQKMLDKTYKPKEVYWTKDFYDISRYLKDAIDGQYFLNGQSIILEGYNAQNLLYLHILSDKGVKVTLKNVSTIIPGDIVITYQPNIKQYIEENFVNKIISTVETVTTYKLYGRKK